MSDIPSQENSRANLLSRQGTILKSRIIKKKTGFIIENDYRFKELDRIKSFLALPPDQRMSQISGILDIVLTLQFFKQIKRDQSIDAVTLMWKYCKYEFFPPKSNIIEEGSVGTKFYVILCGRAAIFQGEDYTKITFRPDFHRFGVTKFS